MKKHLLITTFLFVSLLALVWMNTRETNALRKARRGLRFPPDVPFDPCFNLDCSTVPLNENVLRSNLLSCGSYCFCLNGKSTVARCPENLIFDAQSLSCKDPLEAICIQA